MIDFILVSSMAVTGMIGGVSCEMFQSVERSSHTAKGAECAVQWDDYDKRVAALCSGNSCYAVYIIPPTCVREKVRVWKREFGVCGDGVIRWRNAK